MQICTKQETNYWNIEQDYWAENVIRYYAKAVKERKTSTCIMNLSLCASFVAWFSALLCYVARNMPFQWNTIYIHTHPPHKREVEKTVVVLPYFFPESGPREEKKNKMVEYAFLFCIQISSSATAVFIQWFYLFNFVPRAIPSIAARNGKRVQHLKHATRPKFNCNIFCFMLKNFKLNDSTD